MFMNPFRKKDLDRRRRSSNIFNQKEDSGKVINARVKIVVLVVLVIFGIFTGRLVQLQLLEGESYTVKMQDFTAKKQTFSPPRGNIYDRNGKILAESVMSLNILYYPPENITNKEEWAVAEKFVNDIKIYKEEITILDRELKDMYIAYEAEVNKNDLSNLFTKKEKKDIKAGLIDADKQYDLKLERVDIATIDEHKKAVFQVKMRMGQAPSNAFKTIIEDAKPEQLAYLTEHTTEFRGFIDSANGWKRNYPEGDSIKTILGSVSTQTQGVPKELREYYVGKGYAVNERVGISGIEKQYEEFLAGTKSTYSIKYDETGLAVLSEEVAGKKGYDITLNIDIEFQKKADQVLQDTLNAENETKDAKRKYFDKVYVSAMNPKTGELLMSSGANRDKETGVVFSNPTGVHQDEELVGSAIKIATLYMGLDRKVVTPGEIINDATMSIKGTPDFGSFISYGAINDIQAISKSSNVYMATIAMRLGGRDYAPGAELVVNDGTFELMRSYYNMFGLGVKTEVDIPNEAVGFIGGTNELGKILPLSIGQFDSYTTMQLLQYTSTIANGGYRVQPQLLKKATEVNDRDTVVYTMKKNILSVLRGDRKFLERGQIGMKDCVDVGLCGVKLRDIPVQMASKTGTAEVEFTEKGVGRVKATNATQVAYGPYEDPEIAFSCSAPTSNTGVGAGNVAENVCGDILGELAEYYFSK